MAKQLNVALNFTANTAEAKARIGELNTQLNNLNASLTRPDLPITKEVNEAITATSKLKVALQQSMNVDTGKFDLSKFNQTLKKSGTSLSQLHSQLSAVGPDGRRAFLSLAQSIAAAEIPSKRMNSQLNEMWNTLKNSARWQISSSVLHSLQGAIQSAFNYAEDLNESLTNIRIVTGQSTDQMARFAEKANQAAKALSTTTTRYTDAALIYYQQGLSDEEVQKRTDTTVKMANVTGENAENVSSYMTAIWNNFDDGSKSLEYYADVITKLGAETAASSEEIANGLEKFAAIGDTIGLSYEYATAALTTIIDKTRQSEEVVGTALKTIFARIQGLKVGETTEEGLDLNKYSKALNAYGIQIFDANNNLKDMDSILDEMGEKWQTLSRADKTALAQTVAGVRQYNQLISLMDNWDAMKENIISARGSEGTLQEQADIYAESWQAAGNRVRAAIEEIFSDLINDDFFINLLNDLEKILNFVDLLIDSAGGLKGVLLAISSIILKTFNQQIASGFQDMAYNFKSMTGMNKGEIEYNKEKAINLAQQQPSDDVVDPVEKASLYVSEQRLNIQSALNKKESELSEIQKQILKQQNEYNRELGEQYKKSVQNSEAAKDELRTLRQRHNLSAQQQNIRNENDDKKLIERYKNNQITDREIYNNISQSFNGDTRAAERYTQAIIRAAEAQNELNISQENFSENVIEQIDNIEKEANKIKQLDYSTIFTNALQSVSSLSMGIVSLKSAWDTIQDPDLSGWEKFSSISMSLTMGIPILASGLKGLGDVYTSLKVKTLGHYAALLLNKTALAEETMEFLANSAATLADAKAIDKQTYSNARLAIVAELVGKGMEEEAAVKLVDTLATKGLTKATLAQTAANLGLEASLLPIVAILAAIAVAVGAAIALFDHFTVSSKELSESFDAYNEAKDNVKQLNDELKSLNEQIDELLKKGYSQLTDEEKEQLKVLREQKIELENQLALAKQLEKAKKQEFVDNFEKRAEQGDLSTGKEVKFFTGNNRRAIEDAELGQNFTNSLTSIKSYETDKINQYKAELETAFNSKEIDEANYNLLLDKIALIQKDAAKKAEDLATDYEQAKAFLESGNAEKNTKAYDEAINAVQRYYTYLGDAIDYKQDIVDLYGVSEEDLQELQGSVDKEKDILKEAVPKEFYEQLKLMSEETGLSIEFLADKLGLFKDSVNALTQDDVFENFNKFISGKEDSEGNSLDNVLNSQGMIGEEETTNVNLGQNSLKNIFEQSGVSLEEQQTILMNIDWANQTQAESIIQALQQIEELSNKEHDYSAEAEQLGYTEEQFEALTAAMMRNNEAYKDNEKGAQKAVIVQMRLQKALEKCYETWDEYGDALEEADKSNADYYEGLGQLAEDLTEGLGFEVDWSDVEDHLDLIKKAMEGDTEAAGELAQQLAFDDINTRLDGSEEYFNNFKKNLTDLKKEDLDAFNNLPDHIKGMMDESLSEIQNRWAEAQNYLDNNDLEVGEVVKDKYVDSLNDMIAASGMTKEQANNYLSQIGYEGELETTEVTMPGAETTGHVDIWDGKISIPFHYKQNDQKVEVPYIKSGTLKKGAPNTTGIKNIKPGSQTKSSSGGGKSGGGKSGGSGSKSKADKVDKTKKTDIIDRYKQINDTLDDQSKKLDQLNKKYDRLYGKNRLKNIEKITNALKAENKALKQKKEQAKANLNLDKKIMQSNLKAAQKKAGLKNTKFKFDKDGDISNYYKIMNALYKKLHKKENEYNRKYAGKIESDASKAAKKRLDKFKDQIDNLKDAISQYDETKDLIQEISEEIQDNLNEIRSNNYEKLSYKIELRVTVNENDKKELEYYFNKLDTDIYKSAEALSYLYNKDGDNVINNTKQALENNSKAIEELNKQRALALANPKKGKGISQADYVAGLQEQLDSLYDNLEALRDLDNQMMEYYGNTLNKASEELSKYTSQMDHLTSVLDHYQKVLELTGKGQDYEAMDKILQGQSKTLKNNFNVSKANYEMLEKEKKSIEEKISKMDQTSAAYELEKKKLEDITTATNEAYEEMLGDAESYLETLQKIWENSLENIKKKTSDTLTGGLGFDILLDSMNNLKTYQDEYLTNTNKLFETNKLLSQIQKDIDKTSNVAAKQRYKAFSQEIEQLQKKDELSNLELEIAQAKYKQLQAQMALEEAQNAKSTVRLSRDNEGNYGYVYTADQNAVNNAEDALAQAENDLYNIQLNATNNYGEKMVQAQKEYIEKIAEIDKQYADDDVKRTEARKKAKEEYYNIIDTYSKLYSIAQQEDIRVQEDAWINHYNNIIDKGGTWKATLNDYTDQTEKKFQEWQTETKKVTDAIGLDMGTLSEKVKSVTDQSDALAKITTETVIPAMTSEIEKVNELTTAYGAEREAIEKLIAKKEKLAKYTKNRLAEESGEASEWNASTRKKITSLQTHGYNVAEMYDQNNQLHYTTYNPKKMTKEQAEAKLEKRWGSISSEVAEKNEETADKINDLKKGEKVYRGYAADGTYYYNKNKKKLKATLKKHGGKKPGTIITHYDTGGYTGKWGPEGKLAVLHEKELVLNKEDTNNLLKIIEIVRNVIDGNVATAGFGQLRAAGISTNNETLEQNVTITAEFPNATDHNEIEQAFDSLINRAAQFANRKK